ncbi:MAG: hypothetical protein KJZ93_25300 [Caldilineaceae bacterium]|nr:hypothetical protein [Caldilineaceae bacterium]
MQGRDPPAASEPERRIYRAYLLRCWAEPCGAETVWRFSLETVSEPGRHGFADLSTLCMFLQGELDDQPEITRTTDATVVP